MPYASRYLKIATDKLCMFPFKFITDILVPTAEAEFAHVGRICVFQVCVVPINQAHVLRRKIKEELILLDSFVHGGAQCRISAHLGNRVKVKVFICQNIRCQPPTHGFGGLGWWSLPS